MLTRIVTGLILAVLALGLIFYASHPLLMTLALAMATWAYVEFDRLFFWVQFRIRRYRIVVLICFTMLAMRLGTVPGAIALWTSFVVFVLFQIYHWRVAVAYERAMRAISLEWLGYFYCVSMFGFLVPIVEYPYGRAYLLLLFLIVFGGDTVAYFVGSRFGKHKLVPNLSPKKSWEGSIAAFGASLLSTIVWLEVVDIPNLPERKYVLFLCMSLVISLLAQVGDYFESVLKRAAQQKDSGTLLPGHGGILDRVDGLALSAPAFYGFMTMLVRFP